MAVPGPAVTDVLQAVGPLDGRVMIDAANAFGPRQVTLRSLAETFPRARWVRAFNSLSASIMADDNYRKPPWVMFLSGDEEAKPVVVQLIRDAGFDPVDLGGIDDSPLQDPAAHWGSPSSLTTRQPRSSRGSRPGTRPRPIRRRSGRGCAS